ncbi:putative pentatricopeptide repeat-containing protein At3g49142 [Dioscorea cayenensis subsp. rotundata]|uniref:Pentatricopeptide repeat-containing protein At3g49142 n=1 Tax=Dioscorea cayennensis subsp. rotundata TaxID=55577 RepID=A0AB40ATD0_DIOCR|nr:putative pentatricopeptide repeat-containing protein At3g49142 [Dioscorea cayenensis subsp. rotundata]
MEDRNTVAWNSVISACLMNGMENEGLELYLQMADCGILADAYTVSILLTAAAVSQWSVITGKQLHGLAVKMGLYMDTLIGNSLITMYAKNGEISDSWQKLLSLYRKRYHLLNSIVHAHLRMSNLSKRWLCMSKMKVLGFEPDEFSFVAALAAVVNSFGAILEGIHSNLVKIGMTPNAFVGSALIGISSLCDEGRNFEPDDSHIASILAACANTITVEHGRQGALSDPEIRPKMDAAVANALITMYSRAGREKQKGLLQTSTKNVISWTAMMGAMFSVATVKRHFDF